MIASLRSRLPPSVRPSSLAVITLLLAALTLRLFGLTWDDGHYLHPDERFVVDVATNRIFWPDDLGDLFDPKVSGLNPRSADPQDDTARLRDDFAYGALPLFVTDLVAELLRPVSDTDWHAYPNLFRVGRVLSALFDTLTVLVVYLIGARVFSTRVGLAAAAVAAMAPMSIQLAHFFTTDSWLTFFVALALLCAIRAAEGGSPRWFAAAGGSFGLAMATKGSVFTLAGLIAAAVAYDLWRRWRSGETLATAFPAATLRAGIAGVAALAAFALFEPYALAEPDVYMRALRRQADIVRGALDVPYTRQYVGTTPLAYQLEQLVRWGFGPVAGVLAFVGLPLLLRRFWRGQPAGATLILAWFLGYGVVVALPETKFLRYLAPLTPVLALSAGLAFDAIWRLGERYGGRRLAATSGAVLLAGAALWTASFESIYAHENTRLAASRWILANIPSGSTLSAEYWDDGLPMDLGPGLNARDRQYQHVTFDLYSDRPSGGHADLMLLGDALAGEPATSSVAEAVAGYSYQAAADQLNALADRSAPLSAPIREALARDLEAAAAQVSPGSRRLADGMAQAAMALRQGEEEARVGLRALADTVVDVGVNGAASMIYANLEQIDYVILSSNRVSDAIPRSPWRYPVQSQYYELLESGELGFSLVADFHQYPGIGPLEFDDADADESFINYDHPRVLIFKKNELVPRETYDQLMAAAASQPVSPTRHAPSESLMLDEPVGELPVVADARWSERVTGNSLAAFVVWLGLLVVLQVAGWPLAAIAFGRFADAGWGFARLIALLASGYFVWIAASLEVIRFQAIWTAIALATVAVVGWSVWPRLRRGRSRLTMTREQRRAALACEGVFWVVFGVFFLFRYLNPDSWHPIWGGEKPMEFAHINAILRSAHFPPVDPWFAGGYINYYYYGLYLVAFLFKLTGIPSEIAFNLAQPTIMALLASAGFSVAAALGRDIARRREAAIPSGALGVLLLVGIGNLSGLIMLGRELQGLVGDPFELVWSPSRAIPDAITEFPFFTGLYADLHAHVVALPITVLAIGVGYAIAREPRRFAIAVSRPRRDRTSAGVVGVRFALLALAVGTLGPTNIWDVPVYAALGAASLLMATRAIRPWWTRLAAAGATGMGLAVVGYVAFLPFHRHYVAIASAITREERPTDFWQFASHLGGLLAIVGFGLLVAHVRMGASVPNALQQPLVALLIVVALAAARRYAGEFDEALADGLTIAFVLTIAVVLGFAAWAGTERGFDGIGLPWARNALPVAFAVVLVVLADDQPTLGVLLAFAIVAGVLWLFGGTTAERYAALMVAGAAAVGAGVELIVVSDRMNTIFKFYNQLWVLSALAGAAFIAKMVAESGIAAELGLGDRLQRHGLVGIIRNPSVAVAGREPPDTEAEEPVTVPAPMAWSRAGLVVAALVVVASLAYPLIAIGPRLDQRFTDRLGSGTLNGLDWMDYGTLSPAPGVTISFRGDRAAIDWLNEHVEGTPVIAEASIGTYRGNGSRISIATGLPTIVGWDYHETQQRYAVDVYPRVGEVRRLYDSADPAEKLAVLRRYDVRYIIVGDVERYSMVDGRPYASEAGLAAFDLMVGTSLDVVFSQDGTTIYRVRG